MAVIVNSRDVLLQGTTTRVEQNENNSITANYSATKFSVNNGVATPSTITIVAILNGQLYGTPTFNIISGISSINTSTPGQAVLSYSNMTADTCTIRISLVFFGVTYTTDCTIEGKVTAPTQVNTITATPDVSGKLKLHWTKNSEADILGYEIRSTDTGWGDSAYLYHGASPEAYVTPGVVNVPTTWYVRAYDSSNLYSTTSRSVSYTVVIPSAVTGVTHDYSVTSITNSGVVISWDTASPVFGLKSYRVALTPPSSATVFYTVVNPFLNVDADWVGTATVSVHVVDNLGNQSDAPSSINIVKSLPNAPSTYTMLPAGTELYIKWNTVAKTTFPVAGYEIRTNNTNWGVQDSNLVWRGSSTETYIKSPVLGANSYYINTFDIDNRYGSSGTAISYTVQRPGLSTIQAPSFNDTTTSSAIVKFTWTAPSVTSFIPAKYKVRLSKPDLSIEEVTIDSTSITMSANWVGTATLSVTTIDAIGLESSSAATYPVLKSAPNVVGTVTQKVSAKDVILYWEPVAKTTLPVAGYEMRTETTGWGTGGSGLFWKGNSSSSLPVSNLASGSTNTTYSYYIKTFDTDNVYSTTFKQVDIVVTPPSAIGTITPMYTTSTSTAVSVRLSWTAPTSMFALDYYLITITKSTGNISVKSLTNDYTFIMDWAGDAVINITAYDILGGYSTATQLTIPKQPPGTPGTATLTPKSKSIAVKWTESTLGSLPIAGYEIRTTTTGWGTTGYIWKGSGSLAEITDITAGSGTLYIKAYDTANQYSTTYSSTPYSIVAPTVASISTPIYQDTSVTGATVTFNWTGTEGTFAIEGYNVTLTKPVSGGGTTVVTAKLSSNTWTTIADWVGLASLSISAYDYVNTGAATQYNNINKELPATPSAPVQSVKGTALNLNWNDVAKTTLPVAGYELRSANTNWGGVGALWRGSVSECDLIDLPVGTNNAYLSSYDTDGKYSSSLYFTYVISNPNPPTGLIATYADTTSTGATVTFEWTPPASVTFAISHYIVTLTKPGPIVETIKLDSNKWTTNASWSGTAVLSVSSVDVLGHSSSPSTENFTKTKPTAPVGITYTPTNSGLEIKWNPGTPGSLPIDGYEIRIGSTGQGTDGYIWRGKGTTVTIPSISKGSNTWYIWAYDTDLEYSSTPTTLSFTADGPSTPTINPPVFSTSLTNSTVRLSWTTPSTSQFGVSKYDVTLSWTAPSAGSLSATLNTTDWEVPATWTGQGTFTVKAYDYLNLDSSIATKNDATLVKNVPNTPGVETKTPVGTSLVVDWPDDAKTTLPILGYEIRHADSLWGSSGFHWKGSVSESTIDLLVDNIGLITSGDTKALTWYLKAFDTDGKYSTTPRTISYTVTRPTAPVWYDESFGSASGLTAATITLSWSAVSPTFKLSAYELSYSTITLLVNTNTIVLPADWLGDRTFTIRAKDGLGNYSLPVQKTITKYAPNPVLNFRAQVIDNSVLLYWDLPAKTTLPISHVYIKKSLIGGDWANATIIGEKSGTFTSISELSAGNYTYYIVTVDTDGRESSVSSVPAEVSQPPDFVFNGEFTSDFVTRLIYGPGTITTSLASTTVTGTSTNFTVLDIGKKLYDSTGSLIGTISAFTSVTSVTLSSNALIALSTGIYKIDGIYMYNAIYDPVNASVVLPVDTAETFEKHFTGRNLLAYSEDFSNAYWLKDSTTTVTADSIAAPDGLVTADTVLEATTTAGHYVYKDLTAVAAGAYTFSVYLKRKDRQWGVVQIATDTITKLYSVLIDLNSGTFVSSNSSGTPVNTSYSIIDIGGGWYRVSVTATHTSGNVKGAFGLSSSASPTWASTGFPSYTGVITQGMYAWGAQLESRSYASNYLKTTTSAISWTTPDSQVSAGFPVYIQPGLRTGYYEEIFDYQSVLGSSQATLSLLESNVAGVASRVVTISTSADGINYTNMSGGGTSGFATNFRYVKVRITLTQAATGDIYKLTGMNIRLDAKQKSDAGNIAALSGDTNGTIVNFANEFIEVTSITLTPLGTSAYIPVYDFKDLVITGTYSVTSNVATITTSEAHGLLSGQNVRLYFTTGSAAGVTGVYLITYISNTSYSVTLSGVSNGSGAINTYSNSFRVYVFNTSGLQQSTTVSWAVKGY